MGKNIKNAASPFIQLLKKKIHVPKNWMNKYSIVGISYLIWVSFFDTHSLYSTYKVGQVIKRLKVEKEQLIEEIELAKLYKIDLENNKEKFAREKYFMHKSDEEIFIIEKK
jgi:hypothetical protein